MGKTIEEINDDKGLLVEKEIYSKEEFLEVMKTIDQEINRKGERKNKGVLFRIILEPETEYPMKSSKKSFLKNSVGALLAGRDDREGFFQGGAKRFLDFP